MVASVSERVNVACEAVAGSGKTTTVLHCAREVPHLRFLVLTYNARLKLQTRQRAKELGLSNLEVHSFHAMAARYYAPDCRNDETLRRLVDADAPPHSRAVFDCLVIDEAQDLTPLLHRFVLKILRDRSRAETRDTDARHPDGPAPPSMLVLGDSRQSIYQFRDADPRFLTFADRGVYRLSSDASDDEPPAWRHRTLRTSFRATPNIASFVNDAMLGFPCLRAEPKPSLGDPAGPPVTYLVGNAFDVASQELVDEISFLLEEGYAPDDIFVLTPSLKGAKLNSKTPLAQLENTLVMRLGVPVYVSLADEEELSDSLIRGKVCLTTFHASKGLERPVVIVFGFSDNYFAYYARDAPRAVCPNPLYVAATRASERLYLVGEEEEGGKLPFLRVDPELHSRFGAPLPDWIRVRRCGKMRPPADVVPVPASRFAVTDLVKFLPERTMADVTASLRAETTNAPTRDAAIDGTVPSLAGRGLIESVSDITGLAVVAAHEQRHARPRAGRRIARHGAGASIGVRVAQDGEAARGERGAAPREKDADEVRTDVIVDDVEALRQMREALASEPARVTDFLRLASWYEAMEGGYLFRPFQLSHFDWVPADAAATVAEVLEEHLPTHRGGADVRSVDVRYERRYDVSFRFGAPIVTIIGAADVVTAAEPRGEIFEVKCVEAPPGTHPPTRAVPVARRVRPRAGASARRTRQAKRALGLLIEIPSLPRGQGHGQGQTRVHRRGSLGSARTPGPVREGWRRRVQDASSGDAAERANGGDDRASRGRADAHAGGAHAGGSSPPIGRGGDERRISSRGGGGGGGDARAERGRGRVRRDAGGEPERRRDEEARGRRTGGGEAQTPKG